MVCIAPPLQATLNLRLHLESGLSVSQAVKTYTQKFSEDSFAQTLARWLFFEETGKIYDLHSLPPYRKNLIEILKRGLKGESILDILIDFEKELIEVCKSDLEKHLGRLPFISLIPLMIFQFPAFLMLFIGPLALDLLSLLSQ